MHRPTLRLSLAVTAALLATAALVFPAGAADRAVRIVSSDYAPDPVRITVGDRVTWVNDDDLPHDATGNGWSTPLLLNGDRGTVRFTRAGTYRYTCTIHPGMSGRVIVRAAGGGIAPNTDTAPDGPAAPTGDATPAVLAILAAATIAFFLALRRAGRPRA